jgi:hypothetical protein
MRFFSRSGVLGCCQTRKVTCESRDSGTLLFINTGAVLLSLLLVLLLRLR